MTEKDTSQRQDAEPDRTSGKRLYLAALGATVVLREEGRRLFEYLVERGAPMEEPVRERSGAVKKKAAEDLARTREAVGRAVGKAFGRYSQTDKDEMADLAAQVDRLGARVDKLST